MTEKVGTFAPTNSLSLNQNKVVKHQNLTRKENSKKPTR
jgi:hypothetical protein